MGRFKTSFDLFKRSFAVIKENKKLLLFPLIEFIFIIIIGIFFISPVLLWSTGYPITDSSHWAALGEKLITMTDTNGKRAGVMTYGLTDKIFYAWGILFYLISMFAATFFNVAFYNEIINGLNNRGVSILRGINTAMSKIKLIAIWSLFAGIVGIIIKSLEERFGFVGRLILGLIGIAWSVASIFVTPIIIREEKRSNPLQLLKTSALMLKKTWGEAVIGYVGISGFFMIVFLITLPLLIAACIIVGLTIPVMEIVIALMICLYIVFLFVFGYLCAIANHVYRGALYLYATEGVVPGPYDEDMMNRAWKVKKVKDS